MSSKYGLQERGMKNKRTASARRTPALAGAHAFLLLPEQTMGNDPGFLPAVDCRLFRTADEFSPVGAQNAPWLGLWPATATYYAVRCERDISFTQRLASSPCPLQTSRLHGSSRELDSSSQLAFQRRPQTQGKAIVGLP